MKKVILVLSAAAFFVACNSGTSSTETNTDSTKVTVDSTVVAPAVVDTTHVIVADSTSKMVESTKR